MNEQCEPYQINYCKDIEVMVSYHLNLNFSITFAPITFK